MKDIELGAVQERFADIVWANEPIGSGELVKVCEKGLLQNEDGVVTTLMGRDRFYSAKSEQIMSLS